MVDAPTLEQIARARASLDDVIVTTPVHHWRAPRVAELAGAQTDVFLKLELFQVGGSFKTRGATLATRELSPEQLKRGVVTASGGNHAIAVALAARAAGAHARVFMGRQANRFRQERCRALGAEITIVDDVHQAFAGAKRAAEEDGLAYIHAFEGVPIVLGTSTVGFELMQQVADLDAVIVPMGGGGLSAGMAAAIKQMRPQTEVIGVEPEGADSMRRSFAAGSPQALERVDTIADSLGAPTALPYSYALCRSFVDDIVLVTDDQMRWCMKLLLEEMKLVAEPAAAAATAALLGPLRTQLDGKRVGIVVCGSNIDAESFMQHIAKAPLGANLPPNSIS